MLSCETFCGKNTDHCSPHLYRTTGWNKKGKHTSCIEFFCFVFSQKHISSPAFILKLGLPLKQVLLWNMCPSYEAKYETGPPSFSPPPPQSKPTPQVWKSNHAVMLLLALKDQPCKMICCLCCWLYNKLSYLAVIWKKLKEHCPISALPLKTLLTQCLFTHEHRCVLENCQGSLMKCRAG